MDTAVDQHPGFLINDTARLLSLCFGMRIENLHLSEAQWRVLGSIANLPGITQTQLAEYLDIGKAALGKLIDRLEAAGWVQRSSTATDRRSKCLNITAAAEPLIASMRDSYQQMEREIMQGVSDRQQAQLLQHLRGVCQNLSGSDASAFGFMQLVSRSSRLIRRHFDQQLKQLGFTRSQWLVFTAIYRQQGIQQNLLAASLHMRTAPLGVLLDELERGGWIERRVHPEDRRANQLFLSKRSGQKWQALIEAYENMHRQLLAGVSETQRQQLVHKLQIIRHNLQTTVSDNVSLGKPT